MYDVTDYVYTHPGGDAILKNAGGDATTGFHGDQHPSSVMQLPSFPPSPCLTSLGGAALTPLTLLQVFTTAKAFKIGKLVSES